MRVTIATIVDVLSRPFVRVLDAVGNVIVVALALKVIQWTTGWNIAAWVLS